MEMSNNHDSDTDEDAVDPEPTNMKDLFHPVFNALEYHDGTVEGVCSSAESFLSLFARRTDSSAIVNGVRSLKFTKQHARRLFSGLLPILRLVVSHRFRSSEEEDETQDPSLETIDDLQFMKHAAFLCSAYLDNLIQRRSQRDKKASILDIKFPIIEDAWEVLNILHDSLFGLTSCGEEAISVERAISRACEQYWIGKFVDCECFVTQLIPSLLLKTLREDATLSDLKRLWGIRDALKLLDFEDESIAYLRGLILRSVSNGLYIKQDVGVKLIRFFFLLDKALVSDIHNAIKAQISPTTKKDMLQTFGTIYLNAWRDASTSSSLESDVDDSLSCEDAEASIQSAIEDCVQEMVYASIFCIDNKMARSLRTVLTPLFLNKKSQDIDGLLYKLYNPIIWRATSATNALVRKRACAVLALVHPLNDPNLGKIHLKEIQQKSISTLKKLLCDDDVAVRTAACDATIRILAMYWDAIPSADIRSFLSIIVKHANDTSAASVRVQAVQGIMMLMDTKVSHGVLRSLLPKLGNLIHDNSQRVRLAAVKLLLKVNTLSGLKFYHVVPSEHILARLAAEGGENISKGSVASTITKLLVPSYFPHDVTGSEQMRRTISFLQEHPTAAKIFYANVFHHLDLHNITKLIVMLLKTLFTAVQNDKKHKEKIEGINASNTSLMVSMVEIISCLWRSIYRDLEREENEDSRKLIQSVLKNDHAIQIYSHFEGKIGACDESNEGKKRRSQLDRICSEILYFSGFVTVDDAGDLSEFLSSRILDYSKMSKEERKNMNISSHLCLLCAWGMSSDVVESLASSITSVLDEMECSHLQKKRRSDRKRQFSEVQQRPANADSLIIPTMGDAAVYVLSDVLSGQSRSFVSARCSIIAADISCEMLLNSLEKALDIAKKVLAGEIVFTDVEKLRSLLCMIESYGKLSLHKEANVGGSFSLSPREQKILSLVSNHAVPILLKSADIADTTSPFIDLNLSRISLGGCSQGSPKSMNLSPKSQKRRNLNVTPPALDSSFIGMEKLGDGQCVMTEEQATPQLLAKVMSLALIQSSLCIFSERISLGGDGHDQICLHIVQWCHSTYEDDCLDIATNLGRFVRALQECTHETDESTLKMKQAASKILKPAKGDNADRHAHLLHASDLQ